MYAADAVMALALALNETLANSPLDQDIVSILKSITFSGATVSYNTIQTSTKGTIMHGYLRNIRTHKS